LGFVFLSGTAPVFSC